MAYRHPRLAWNYFNIWLPVGGDVWGGFGAQPCWRKYITGGGCSKLKSSCQFVLCFVSSLRPVPATMPAACMLDPTTKNTNLLNANQNKLFFLYVVLVTVFYQSNRKATNASGVLI